ncbi:MAG: hypothetical protein ACE5KX_04320, partial [Acidimicrobiia bacterium]
RRGGTVIHRCQTTSMKLAGSPGTRHTRVRRPRPSRRLHTLAWGLVTVEAVGNLAILLASLAARITTPAGKSIAAPQPVAMPGVTNFLAVADGLWRGGAPSSEGYRALAAAGVGTIVDLRAEDGPRPPRGSGLDHVALPIRDGRSPTSAQVERFLALVRTAPRTVFVHCGAGVGRTGTMTAAYLIIEGGRPAPAVLWETLAVGPPTLEQAAFVLGLGKDAITPPSRAVIALSRMLDAPRRLWAWISRA